MISKKRLRNIVDIAGDEFKWCWKVLAAMKAGSNAPQRGGECSDLGTAILEYQKKLLAAIQSVERAYRDVRQEEKRLIGRKASYKEAWFRRRMKELSGYRRSLKDILGIGRALGDGFAWPFYERDRDLISEHFKHQLQLLLPPGTGGIGERQMLLQLQGLGKQLLIYHGTTSFLRMGDISFIDLNTQRVASIGELKTRHVEGNEYTTTMSLMTSDQRLLPQVNVSDKIASDLGLDAETDARRNRQTRQIGEAIARARTSSGNSPDVGLFARFHFDELQEIVSQSGLDHFEFSKVSPGLLIGAIKFRRGRLGASLTRDVSDRLDRMLAGMVERAKGIIDHRLPGNCFHFAWLGSGYNELIMQPESLPILWWNVLDEVLEGILFGHLLVLTLYNPAHFWEQLRHRGFDLSWEGNARLPRVRRARNGRRCELRNVDWFRGLIQRNLMTEESALELLDSLVERSEPALGGRDGRVDLRYRLVRYGVEQTLHKAS